MQGSSAELQAEEQQQQPIPDENIQINPEGNREENDGNQQNEGQENWQPKVTVEHVGQRYFEKFKTKGLVLFVWIDNLEGDNGTRMHVNGLMARLTVSIQEMLNRVLNGIPNHDFVRIVINNRYLQNPIYVPFQRRDQINVHTILDTIEKLLNSNEEFLIDGFLEVSVIHISMPRGGKI